MVVQSVGCAIERICILTTCLPRVAAPMPNARKRAAKWVAISRSDLRTRGLLMHLIAQNVGCALGRIRIVTTCLPRVAAPMANAHTRAAMRATISGTAPCNHEFQIYLVAQNVCCARGRTNVSSIRSARGAAQVAKFARGRCSVGHTLVDAITSARTLETRGCAECPAS